MNRLLFAALFLVCFVIGGFLAYQFILPAQDGGRVAMPGTAPQEMPPPPEDAEPVDVAALLARLPSDVLASHDTATYDATTGVTTARGIVFTNAKNPLEKVLVAQAEFLGLDLEAVESIFNVSGYRSIADPDMMPLFSRVTLRGVEFQESGITAIRIGQLEITDMLMKQFVIPPEGLDPRQRGQEQAFAFAAQLAGMMLDAVQFDTFTIRDLALDMDQGGQRISYGWDLYSMEDVDRGRFGRFSVSGLRSTSRDPQTGFEMTTIMDESFGDGMDVSALVPHLLRGELPPVTESDLISVGKSGTIGVKYIMPGIGVTSIPRVETPAIEFSWLIPQRLDVRYDGVFKPDPALLQDQMGARILAALGQLEFPFSVTFDWSYAAESGNAELRSFGFDMEGLFGVSVEAAMGGLELDAFASRQAVEALGERATLRSAALKVSDRGGTDKVVQVFASENGMTVEDARELMKFQILAMAAPPDGSPIDPAMAALFDAVSQFLDRPGTLILAASPPSPLPLAALGTLSENSDPDDVQALLGVRVEVAQP